jgi:hypothetical protein
LQDVIRSLSTRALLLVAVLIGLLMAFVAVNPPPAGAHVATKPPKVIFVHGCPNPKAKIIQFVKEFPPGETPGKMEVMEDTGKVIDQDVVFHVNHDGNGYAVGFYTPTLGATKAKVQFTWFADGEAGSSPVTSFDIPKCAPPPKKMAPVFIVKHTEDRDGHAIPVPSNLFVFDVACDGTTDKVTYNSNGNPQFARKCSVGSNVTVYEHVPSGWKVLNPNPVVLLVKDCKKGVTAVFKDQELPPAVTPPQPKPSPSPAPSPTPKPKPSPKPKPKPHCPPQLKKGDIKIWWTPRNNAHGSRDIHYRVSGKVKVKKVTVTVSTRIKSVHYTFSKTFTLHGRAGTIHTLLWWQSVYGHYLKGWHRITVKVYPRITAATRHCHLRAVSKSRNMYNADPKEGMKLPPGLNRPVASKERS